MAQERLYDAEADVEVKQWEKTNSDTALCEINQEFESQRLQLQQANQWADHAQREKISLCGELEMRNRLFKKLKNWEEFVAKKQIEQDMQEMMNCLYIKRGIRRL